MQDLKQIYLHVPLHVHLFWVCSTKNKKKHGIREVSSSTQESGEGNSQGDVEEKFQKKRKNKTKERF